MIKAYNFKLEDLERFTLTEDIPDLKDQMALNASDPNKDIVSLVTANGQVIAIAGINHLRVGVCEAWIIRGKGIEKNKFHFYKSIKRLVEFVILNMKIHRFEIAISDEFKGGRKWAETLGFNYEHTAEAYDFNYTNHDIFVRITKWPQEQQ